MYRFSLFAFAGSLGSVFAFRIDSIMIPKFLSMEANGTFSIGVTLASALAIPATGIFILYAPLISNYIKNNQIAELDLKYKEISKLLFFIGALLYSCIFLGIENLFMLLPTHENLIGSIPVILILGFNVLINMGTGFNGEIITYSKHYKFNLIAIGLLIVLNISLNLMFIKVLKYGIEGVAVASLISMLLFNFSKLLFIYKKFKILPFDKSYIKLILVFVTVLFISYNLPILNSPIFNLIYKTLFCLFLNLLIIYKLKLVYSYNFWFERTLLKLRF
jgi:O-antigen/teichoic acid export membrane protein